MFALCVRTPQLFAAAEKSLQPKNTYSLWHMLFVHIHSGTYSTIHSSIHSSIRSSIRSGIYTLAHTLGHIPSSIQTLAYALSFLPINSLPHAFSCPLYHILSHASFCSTCSDNVNENQKVVKGNRVHAKLLIFTTILFGDIRDLFGVGFYGILKAFIGFILEDSYLLNNSVLK